MTRSYCISVSHWCTRDTFLLGIAVGLVHRDDGRIAADCHLLAGELRVRRVRCIGYRDIHLAQEAVVNVGVCIDVDDQ